MDEIVILSDDLSAWTGEVQGVGFFGAAKVVELEDQMLGQVGLITPDDPTDTGIDETELMARSIDRFYTGKLEVPVGV